MRKGRLPGDTGEIRPQATCPDPKALGPPESSLWFPVEASVDLGFPVWWPSHLAPERSGSATPWRPEAETGGLGPLPFASGVGRSFSRFAVCEARSGVFAGRGAVRCPKATPAVAGKDVSVLTVCPVVEISEEASVSSFVLSPLAVIVMPQSEREFMGVK